MIVSRGNSLQSRVGNTLDGKAARRRDEQLQSAAERVLYVAGCLRLGRKPPGLHETTLTDVEAAGADRLGVSKKTAALCRRAMKFYEGVLRGESNGAG